MIMRMRLMMSNLVMEDYCAGQEDREIEILDTTMKLLYEFGAVQFLDGCSEEKLI